MSLAAFGAILLLSGGLTRSPLALAGAGLAWVLLLLSGLPFYAKILRRDAPVLIVAPLLLFVRAWALGWGFFLGNLRLLFLEHFNPYENYKF
jgi:hypothetical protein